MLNDPPIPHSRTTTTVPMRADFYPATVAFSFGVNPYSRARAVVTADRVLVLVESGRGVGVLYEAKLEDVSGDRRQLVATTADGAVTITRQTGCGCGSRLRSYRPFGQMVAMSKVPA
jgi:hypothetical protein